LVLDVLAAIPHDCRHLWWLGARVGMMTAFVLNLV
jgi:hypothetical protein